MFVIIESLSKIFIAGCKFENKPSEYSIPQLSGINMNNYADINVDLLDESVPKVSSSG